MNMVYFPSNTYICSQGWYGSTFYIIATVRSTLSARIERVSS